MMEARHQGRKMMTDPVVYYFVSQVTHSCIMCAPTFHLCPHYLMARYKRMLFEYSGSRAVSIVKDDAP